MYKYLILFVSFFSCQAPNAPTDHSISSTVDKTFEIGTRYYTWQDTDRMDDYYGGYRTINVQIWYPIDARSAASNASIAPYYSNLEKAQSALPHWSDSEVAQVKDIPSNALIDTPILPKKEKYPLVLLSPSLGGNMNQYTFYAEQLAKSGFIVAGVNHLHESEFVIDHAGTVWPANHTFHDSLKTLNIPAQITADEYRAVKGIRQKVLGQDLLFCLDQLAQLKDQNLRQAIDFEAIGVMGHSIGGAAAVYASLLDDRIKAVLNLDGTPPSVALEQGIATPFMFIEDLTDYKHHTGYKKLHARRMRFCEKVRGDAYRVLLPETNHNSFLDIHYHVSDDPADQQKALDVLITTNKYVVFFFSKYLHEQPIFLPPTEETAIEVFTFKIEK
jgi:dienelactone hydrolase